MSIVLIRGICLKKINNCNRDINKFESYKYLNLFFTSLLIIFSALKSCINYYQSNALLSDGEQIFKNNPNSHLLTKMSDNSFYKGIASIIYGTIFVICFFGICIMEDFIENKKIPIIIDKDCYEKLLILAEDIIKSQLYTIDEQKEIYKEIYEEILLLESENNKLFDLLEKLEKEYKLKENERKKNYDKLLKLTDNILILKEYIPEFHHYSKNKTLKGLAILKNDNQLKKDDHTKIIKIIKNLSELLEICLFNDNTNCLKLIIDKILIYKGDNNNSDCLESKDQMLIYKKNESLFDNSDSEAKIFMDVDNNESLFDNSDSEAKIFMYVDNIEKKLLEDDLELKDISKLYKELLDLNSFLMKDIIFGSENKLNHYSCYYLDALGGMQGTDSED